jgi:hypothetical protein
MFMCMEINLWQKELDVTYKKLENLIISVK